MFFKPERPPLILCKNSKKIVKKSHFDHFTLTSTKQMQNMPTYTFTPSSSYDLATHKVSFTATRLRVMLTTTDHYVFNQDYTNGIAFHCSGNNFQVGTLMAIKVIVKQVDFEYANAKLWVEEVNNANQFVGANDLTDSAIFNVYNLNQCPVEISKNAMLTQIKCPCDSGPCANECYRYGRAEGYEETE